MKWNVCIRATMATMIRLRLPPVTDGTKVSLLFDEFIKLEKATEKVVVSPPQVQQPEIKASGKRIPVSYTHLDVYKRQADK